MIDGDTIVLSNDIRVRLVQIDTPEVGTGECFSRAAGRELRTMLPDGAALTLVADRRLDQVDRYGRLLRYVFRDGQNLNLELVRRGAATVWFFDGDRGRNATQLLAAAHAARRAGRGLWGACPLAVWDPFGPASAGPRSLPPSSTPRPVAGGAGCDLSYPTVCIPPRRPNLDCRKSLPELPGATTRPAPLRRRGRRPGLRALSGGTSSERSTQGPNASNGPDCVAHTEASETSPSATEVASSEPVGEVDRVAVVELGRERRRQVDARHARGVFDRLPVDGVVHVTWMSTSVARSAHGSGALPLAVPGARAAWIPAGLRRLRVDAERLDPRGPLVGPEVDPHAVDFDPAAPVALERPPPACRDRRKPAAPRPRASPPGHRGTACAPRPGSAARTRGARRSPPGLLHIVDRDVLQERASASSRAAARVRVREPYTARAENVRPAVGRGSEGSSMHQPLEDSVEAGSGVIGRPATSEGWTIVLDGATSQ